MKKLDSDAKSLTISRVYRCCCCCCCNFFRQNPRRFPLFCFGCVSFPMKINNPFWCVTVLPKQSDKFHWTWNKNTHYEKIAKVSPSNKNFSRRIKNNKTIIQSGEAPCLTGEELPPHSGELKHALTQAGGPTHSQLSRLMSSGHHISMEHRLRKKQVNSDTNASNKKYLKEIQ